MAELSKQMLTRSCLIVLLFGFPTLGMCQDGYPRDRGFDVLSYDFDLKINDLNDVIQGRTRAIVQREVGSTKVVFDLVGVKNGKGMSVKTVEVSNRTFTYVHEQDLVSVTIKDKPQSKDTITIYYEGIPGDGLIISKNKHGNRTFFGDNWPNRAHHWIPVVDHPSEKALVSFSVTHPNKYQVVANGYLKSIVDVDSLYRKTTWVSKRELPSKVCVIGAAQFAVETTGEVEGIPVSTWVYPEERVDGFYDYALCRDILEYFTAKVAPYPYEKLANVQSKTRYGGMENAGCIFYHEKSIDGKRGSEELFAHEIAHQWFGNSASEADWHHVWLSEGFATYLTEVYKQDAKGEKAFKDGMEQARIRVAKFQKKYPDAATIDTNIQNLNQLLSPMTYQRAAWFLHMLRSRVGDDNFWKGIRQYYREYQFGNAYTIDFQRVMEKVSQQNLELFFERWLYQPGMVDMELKWKYKSSKKRIELELIQPKDSWFPWSASLQFINEKGKTFTTTIYHVDQAKTKMEISLEKAPQKVLFDPDNRVLKW